MRINIYSFLLQDIVFSIDLSNYMLYNQICLGNSINTAFPADFFNVKENSLYCLKQYIQGYDGLFVRV